MPPAPFHHRFELVVGSLAPARHALNRWLDDAGVARTVRDDLAVVASEFMTRALERPATHAFLSATSDGRDVEIGVALDQSTVSNVARIRPAAGDPQLSRLLVERLCEQLDDADPVNRGLRCRRKVAG
jgi:hypothetical protein